MVQPVFGCGSILFLFVILILHVVQFRFKLNRFLSSVVEQVMHCVRCALHARALHRSNFECIFINSFSVSCHFCVVHIHVPPFYSFIYVCILFDLISDTRISLNGLARVQQNSIFYFDFNLSSIYDTEIS